MNEPCHCEKIQTAAGLVLLDSLAHMGKDELPAQRARRVTQGAIEDIRVHAPAVLREIGAVGGDQLLLEVAQNARRTPAALRGGCGGWR